MAKAVLFKERINGWAKYHGVIIKDMNYIESSGFFYIDIDQPVLYWKELKELEYICNNMGIEIYDIMQSVESEDDNYKWTIWLS